MEPTGQHGRVAKTSSTQANYRRHHRQYVENQERERVMVTKHDKKVYYLPWSTISPNHRKGLKWSSARGTSFSRHWSEPLFNISQPVTILHACMQEYLTFVDVDRVPPK